MAHTTKIATCCYCGSRTVLQLTARDGHELACGSCGAPLHYMKPIKQSVKQSRKAEVKQKRGGGSNQRRDRFDHDDRKRRKKPRKSMWKKAFEARHVRATAVDIARP